MTAPGGLLDFFALEAAEYLDRLDSIASAAASAGLDVDGLHRNARALRGSATMARQSIIADLATSLERVAKSIRDGAVAFEPAHAALMISSVDELRTLVRSAKNLGAEDESRARALGAELDRLAPAPSRRSSSLTPVSSSTSFLAVEIDEIASAIATLRSRPDDRGVLDGLLERVRRLRGIAALKDLPPLAEVIEGAERAVRPLEEAGKRLSGAAHELLAAATDVFAKAAHAMRQGDRPAVASPETRRFATALASLEGTLADAERIIPIAELYYADAGPHVVHRAENPPMTPAQRFRMEVVSLAEHLRRLVGDARSAADDVARERLGRELRGALRSLNAVAESFGEAAVARFAELTTGAAERLDGSAMNALDEAAALLADPNAGADDLARRLASLSAQRGAAAAAAVTPAAPQLVGTPTPLAAPIIAAPIIPAPAPAPRETAPFGTAIARPQPTPPSVPVIAPPVHRTTTPLAVPAMAIEATRRAATPVPPAAAAVPTAPANGLQSLMQQGLMGLSGLGSAPLTPATEVADDLVVPIDRLLYRGRAALERAVEIRNGIRTRGTDPTQSELDEIFDLLDLVATE